jgi:hypothetical protein
MHINIVVIAYRFLIDDLHNTILCFTDIQLLCMYFLSITCSYYYGGIPSEVDTDIPELAGLYRQSGETIIFAVIRLKPKITNNQKKHPE